MHEMTKVGLYSCLQGCWLHTVRNGDGQAHVSWSEHRQPAV